ncbi:MAG: type II toxin-antitoxin system MqsA family antitoxin [Clostridia bacterium]|nr:type II toxin-antitoxin system MqsA family antitoxin [Clostridia bacterium]
MDCFMCKGEVIEKKVNYMVDLESTIIIIKCVPAKVCTQCGEQYFEDQTSENIENIVNKLKDLSTEVTIINYEENVA